MKVGRGFHVFVLRIMRDNDRSIGLTGYVFSEMTANVVWLVFCCGMLKVSNQMYRLGNVQPQPGAPPTKPGQPPVLSTSPTATAISLTEGVMHLPS